jgi:hypothetical protein
MSKNIQGFYAVYMSAAAGNGLALISLFEGVLVGVDTTGGRFDGVYNFVSDSDICRVVVEVKIEGSGTLIQGVPIAESGLSYFIKFERQIDDLLDDFFTVDTAFGKVNVRLELLRSLDESNS